MKKYNYSIFTLLTIAAIMGCGNAQQHAPTIASSPNQNGYLFIPPSTTVTAPVIYLALGETRNAAALAISWGVPKSPSGISASINLLRSAYGK